MSDETPSRPEPGSDQLEQERLAELVLNSADVAERHLAARQLVGAQRIKELLRELKKRDKDKVAAQILRDKLRALAEIKSGERQLVLRAEEALAAVRELAEAELNDQYAHRLRHLRGQWSALLPELPASCGDYPDQFEFYAQRCASRLEAVERTERARRERLEICARLDSLLANWQQGDLSDEQSDGQVRQRLMQALDHAAARWQVCAAALESAQDAAAHAELKRYSSLCASLRRLVECLQVLETEAPPIGAVKAALAPERARAIGDELDLLDDFLRHLRWPKGLRPASALDRLARHRKHLSEEREACQSAMAADLRRAKVKLRALRQAIAEKRLRQAKAFYDLLNELLPKLAPEQRQRIISGRESAGKELEQLEFIARPRRKNLCEQMEELSAPANEALALKRRAERVATLRESWSALGACDDTNLRQRFERAATRAYAPCKEHFEELKHRREKNLLRLRELRQALENCLASIEGGSLDAAQFAAAEKLLVKARSWDERKGQLPRKEGKDELRALKDYLARLDTLLAPRFQQHAEAKRSLIARAQKLAESGGSRHNRNQAQLLQRVWRRSGNAGALDQELWAEFKQACNQLFAGARDRAADESEAKTEAKAAAKPPAKAKLKSEENPSTGRADASSVRASEHARRHRLEACCRESEDQEGGGAGKLEEAAAARRELCMRLEILVGLDSPEEERAQRMSYQMERLSKGFGRAGDDLPERLAESCAQWLAMPSVGAQLGPELNARFERALAACEELVAEADKKRKAAEARHDKRAQPRKPKKAAKPKGRSSRPDGFGKARSGREGGPFAPVRSGGR